MRPIEQYISLLVNYGPDAGPVELRFRAWWTLRVVRPCAEGGLGFPRAAAEPAAASVMTPKRGR
ncbi:hypothetical protein ACYCCF_23250 [Streptomyces argenteolus]|uniref:hypothetical protein n=1 Tax=Streptomyces sp. NPDC025273 TaxID=3155251 RepID=UPI0033D32FC7